MLTARIPRLDDPQLATLTARYARHPVAPSQWTSDYVRSQVDVANFRGHGAFVRQNAPERQYRITYDYLRQHDPFGLADRLEEDGDFGVEGHWYDGQFWTRDLMDSVSELTFLAEEIPGFGERVVSVLDIGAGYGRFAHRCKAAFPRSRLVLCDGVPMSAALCRFYLAHRGVDAEVAPLDEIDATVGGRRIDLAVGIHSFNEMAISAVRWWLALLARLGVPRLLLVPNNVQGLRTMEPDGSRLPFDPVLADFGYTLHVGRDKYRHDATAQRYGLYPGMYLLFTRNSGTGR